MPMRGKEKGKIENFDRELQFLLKKKKLQNFIRRSRYRDAG